MLFLQVTDISSNSYGQEITIDPILIGYAIVLLAFIGEWLVALLTPNRLSFIKSPHFIFEEKEYLLKIMGKSPQVQFTVTTSDIKLYDKKQSVGVSMNNVLSASGGYRNSKYWLIVAIIAFVLAIIISLVSGGEVLDFFMFPFIFLLIHVIPRKSAYITVKTKGGEYHGVFFKAKAISKNTLDTAVNLITEQIAKSNNF